MRKLVVVAAVLICLACSGRAEAGLIFYSESITTDGILGGTAFTGKLVTLTFTGDTTGVSFFQGNGYTQYTNVPTVATVTVAGIAMGTFTDPISLSVFDYGTFSEFEALDTATSTDILNTYSNPPGFAGYDMKGPLAPVSGGAVYTPGTIFGTGANAFEFTKAGGGVSTVSASVPEPSSLAMSALGIVGPLVWWRRAISRRLR